MRYYTTSSLSNRIHQTPEGYLLCLDVPVARLGVQEYLAEEAPDVTPDKDGIVLAQRLAEDVFAEETIASFVGKSITLEHPEGEDGSVDFVDPENWQELTRGVVLMPRRGEEDEADLLLADLLITEPQAIRAVQEGMRQVSCGYDADLKEIKPGLARQVNIIGNHIALVPHGRCGARCSIRDESPKEPLMAKKKGSIFDRLFGNPKFQQLVDEAAAEAEKEEKAADNAPAADSEQAATDNDLTAIVAKLDEMLLLLRSLAEGKAGTGDSDEATDDSEEATGDEEATADSDPDDEEEKTPAKTGDAHKNRLADAETVRRAKVLAPNLAARVGDSACIVKRAALRNAVKDANLKKVVDACLRGSSLDGADCLTLDAAFVAASEVGKRANNTKTADSLTRTTVHDFGKATTPEDINRANREFHAKGK